MPRILVTFPGKHGDLLWALPTVRAIAEGCGTPVSLGLSPAYSSLAPLIRRQSYIEDCFAIPSWDVVLDSPITPWNPYVGSSIDASWAACTYDQILHLGYRGWPEGTLPYSTYRTVQQEYPDVPLAPLDLERAWIVAPSPLPATDVRYVPLGFTNEWIELKVGIFASLAARFPDVRFIWLASPDTRFHEWCVPQIDHWNAAHSGARETSWEIAAEVIGHAGFFLGDCSALHVLACALGVPCVLVEPSEARWHPIFYPYGMDGPQVTVVKGNDGRPSFDARHTRDLIARKLKELA